MNHSFVSILRRHWHIVAISFFVACVTAGPTFVFMQSSAYQGIPLMYTDTESYYLSRINAAYHGCVLWCNPFTKNSEDKGYPTIDPSLSPLIMALPGIVFGMTVVDLKLVYELLLTNILCLLIYALVYRLTTNILLSITGVLLIIFGFNIINSVSFFSLSQTLSVISFKIQDFVIDLPYARIVNPAFSSIVFFTYLHFLLTFYKSPSKKNSIVLSFIHGFSFYIYFYTYSFITVLAGVSTVMFFMMRERQKALLMALSSGLGVILGMPILYSVYELVHHPLYEGLYQYSVHAVHRTHAPHITVIGITILLTFSILVGLYKKRIGIFSPQSLLIIALTVTCFVVKNQQIISGTIVEHFHYDWYYLTPVLILWLCFSLHLFKKYKYTMAWILVVVCCILVINGVLTQITVYRHTTHRIMSYQKYAPALMFLKQHIPAETVIIAPSLEEFLPMYTNLYGIWSRNTELFYLHTEEQNFDGKHALTSTFYFDRALREYGARYLVLTKEELKEIPFDIQPYIKTVIYKDTLFTVYELIS